jgi:hypothetical protein
VRRALLLIISASLFTPVAGASGVEEIPDKSALILDFAKGDGVTDGTLRLVNDVIAAAFGAHEKLTVMTNKDLERVIGMEAEKQAAGCESDTSCLAELGDALGADYVVSGSVGALGDLVLVNLTVSEGDQPIERFRAQTTDPAQLPDLLDARIGEALLRLFPVEEPVPAPEPEPEAPPLTGLQWGGVGVASGGALMALGSGISVWLIEGELANETPSNPSERPGTQGMGRIMLVGLVLGVAAVAGGVGMVAFGGEG